MSDGTLELAAVVLRDETALEGHRFDFFGFLNILQPSIIKSTAIHPFSRFLLQTPRWPTLL